MGTPSARLPRGLACFGAKLRRRSNLRAVVRAVTTVLSRTAGSASLSYVPHTFRANALLELKREPRRTIHLDVHMYTSQVAAAARDELAKQLNLNITVNAPPIASWIARDVESRSDLLPRVLEIRATEPARSFRRWVTEQERILQEERES